ncbi:TIGR03364 family FAD-dependent oxidoreductase [Euzebyella marina]|uniref:TIGR03364 family FAD-dependent oxidoreductase n=1 Tax=Euzebyella marina TaxID=1761453 RepID=A0A3G2L151_9FLAO|nr:TIGR03364 family FAD-dependent oxidoreductase [Euzebyella marina]AYN65951.1 TIGR03364 family FAD-dependent oxidoreductase [Euzebyella marina]
MNQSYDLIVVGGGVLGTFHAYHAVNAGLKVALIEKDMRPQGATVRNFGQVVPSGMNTKWQNFGRESLAIYKEIQEDFDITVRQEGSIYLASNEEEVQLLEELKSINETNGYTSKMLTKNQCLAKYASLREDYVKAGLFFPEEVKVEPRTMINKLQQYLQEKGLDLYMGETVMGCDALRSGVQLSTSKNRIFSTVKAIICNGSEFKYLYPNLFEESDLEVSKLQMMQTKVQPNYKLPSSILTGLSIRRYEAFSECPSYRSIKTKEDPQSFEKKWGIHILFKQALDGSIIIGDSHEYAPAGNIEKLGFDLNMDVDSFILKEAKKILNLPTYEIQNRWFGMYSQCKASDIYQRTIDEDIHIITGIGGKGMTGSAGFAKHNIKTIFNLEHA